MEGFVVLLAFLALGALALGPIAFFANLGHGAELRELRQAISEMRARLAEIEARLERTAAIPREVPATVPTPLPTPVAPEETEPPPLPVAASPVSEPPPPPLPPSPEETPTPEIAATPAPTKRPRASWEEAIGARWAVWVGGMAIALGALLLVRYSIENGYFGPGARVTIGLLLAAALMGAGERLRRGQDPAAALMGSEAARANAPATLTGAGIVAAFGSLYAAHALYGFIGGAPAFVLLGAVGLGAIALAWMHGPALAALGLLGSLAGPLLVNSDHPSPWPVVGYLVVVGAATYGLALLRGWLWLALSTAAGGALWTALLNFGGGAGLALDERHAALAALVTQTALAALFLGYAPYRFERDEDARFDIPASATLAVFLGLAAIVFPDRIGLEAFDAWSIVAAVAFTAALALTGFFAASVASAAALAGLAVLAFQSLWPNADPALVLDPAALFKHGLWPPPTDLKSFAGFSIAAALGVGALAGQRLLAGPKLGAFPSAFYAGAAALTPLGAMLIAELRLSEGRPAPEFSVLEALLAALFVGGGALFRRRLAAEASEATRLGLGALAAAGIAALGSGLAFALDGGALTVSLAITAAGSAYTSRKLEIPALRWCVAGLGVLIAARLAYEPRIVGVALSPTPIFNWLLFGYGAPAVCFGLAARWMRPGGSDTPLRVADSLTILFSAFLAFFEIRHFINHGDPFARGSDLIEQALMAVSGFGFAIVLTRLDAARANIVFRAASLIAGALATAAVAFGLFILVNPFVTDEPVEGGAIFNALLLGYGLPALLAGALGLAVRDVRPRWHSLGYGGLATALGLAYAFLQLRMWFHGERIGFDRGFTLSELGLDAAVGLLLALASTLLGGDTPRARRVVGAGFGASVLIGVIGLCGFENPWLTDEAIAGGVAINTLLVAYALPAGLTLALASRVGSTVMRAAAVLWLFAYVSLETRRNFQDARMGLERGVGDAEFYAYSAVWLALGLGLLVYGVFRHSRDLRYASAFFVIATTLKVFLFDFAGLEGIYRALSFIGLGFALIGIGLVYQKLIFAAPPVKSSDQSQGGG